MEKNEVKEEGKDFIEVDTLDSEEGEEGEGKKTNDDAGSEDDEDNEDVGEGEKGFVPEPEPEPSPDRKKVTKKKYTMAQLKKELEKKGESTEGSLTQLISRFAKLRRKQPGVIEVPRAPFFEGARPKKTRSKKKRQRFLPVGEGEEGKVFVNLDELEEVERFMKEQDRINYAKVNIKRLREIAEERGLDTKGERVALIARLAEDDVGTQKEKGHGGISILKLERKYRKMDLDDIKADLEQRGLPNTVPGEKKKEEDQIKEQLIARLIKDDKAKERIEKMQEEGDYEEAVQFGYEMVDIYPHGVDEIAKQLGLPMKEPKLVGKIIKSKIREAELRFNEVYRMKESKGGLVPLKGASRTIKLLSPKLKSVIGDAEIDADAESAKKVVTKNPYKPKFGLYTRVSFVSREGEKLQGIVVGFTKQGIDISVAKQGKRPVIHKIKYENPNLKIIKKKVLGPEKKGVEGAYMKFDRSETVQDIVLGNVPDKLRRLVIDTYVSILTEITGDDKKVNKAPQNFGEIIGEPMSYDEFHLLHLERYIYKILSQNEPTVSKSLRRDSVGSKVSKKDYDAAVKQEAEDRNTSKLLDSIISVLGSGFTDETSAQDFMFALRKKKVLSIPEIYLLRNIEKEGDKASQIKGDDLKKMIASSILEFNRTIPSDPMVYYRAIREKRITDKIRKMKESEMKNYAKDFAKDRKFGGDMKKMYEDYKKGYQKSFPKGTSKKSESQSAKKEVSTIREEVEKFEQIAYGLAGSTVTSYLMKVLVPFIFLDGVLAKYAVFFRAKIANGSFKFSAMNSANIAHFLPEFSMGAVSDPPALSKNKFATAGDVIYQLLKIQMVGTLDFYLGILDPTRRKENRDRFRRSSDVARPLIDMIEPVTETCKKSSGTGTRAVVKDGKYVYRTVGRGKDKHKEKVYEDIPEGDMVLCYDEKNNKFECHSVDEVSRDLKNSKGSKILSSRTGMQYPSDFIKRFEEKYKGKKVEDLPEKDESGEPVVEDIIEGDAIGTKAKVPKAAKKVTVSRHKPTKERENEGFTEVQMMAVMGDEIDLIPLFQTEIQVEFENGDVIEIPITERSDDPQINVAVLSYTVGNKDTMEKLFENAKYFGKGVDIYVVGVGSPTDHQKTTDGHKLKKVLGKRLKYIFFSPINEDDLIATLQNVVLHEEGDRAATKKVKSIKKVKLAKKK